MAGKKQWAMGLLLADNDKPDLLQPRECYPGAADPLSTARLTCATCAARIRTRFSTQCPRAAPGNAWCASPPCTIWFVSVLV